jgi:uncharacterized protein
MVNTVIAETEFDRASLKTRYDVLDALRGFALLGICLANIPVFAGWIFVEPAAKKDIFGAGFYDAFLLFSIDGRFYTIFSFLFGLGFALQLSKIKESSTSAAASRYLRRISILLIIGLFHNFFLWIGDILTLYALLGFALFAVRKLSDRSILSLAGLMLLLPIPGYIVFWYFDIAPDLGLYALTSRIAGGDGSLGVFFTRWIESMTTSDIMTFFQKNLEIGVGRFGYYFDTWRIPKVFGVMLIGLWAGRQLVAGNLLENKRLLKRVCTIGLLIGLFSSIFYTQLEGLDSFSGHSNEGFWSVAAYMLAVFPTGFGYIAGFTLIWLSSPSVLRVFAASGRMALTNYLTQTLISIFLFYGIGLGLGISGGPISFVITALSIVIVQTLLSNIWLKHFEFGPIEWLWRCGTYGKMFKIRKQSTERNVLTS